MRLGKKSKLALAFALFVGFALTDINLHEFIGLYLAGVILIGLGIWLRKWRNSLEFYRRLKRAIYTVGFLTMFSFLLLFIPRLENWFYFMVGLELALFGLLICVKKKHHIVEFQSLEEQQRQHNDFVMSNYGFYPYKLLVDWMLRKPKYASVRNALAREESIRSIGKGRTNFVFEAVFPLVIIIVIILFATGIAK